MGIKSLGVDPSINVGKIANDNGLETLIGFFNSSSVEKIINDYGKPDTIVASSVFTHIENPKQFAIDIKNLIEENGFLILEVEYLSNFIKNIQFERFYFDRPFYYSLLSIKILFQQVGMSLVNVEHIDTHGGSIRCYIKNSKDEKPTSSVEDIIKQEKENLTIETFKIFQKKKIYKTKINYYKELENISPIYFEENFVTKKNILLNKEFKELLKKCIILLENLDLWENIKIEDLIKNFINTNKIKFISFGKPLRFTLINLENGPAVSDIFFILGKKNSILRLNNYIKG